jgi:hypothetical protein
MRLINANALIAEMHNVILEDGEDRRTFYEVIERQPTIEPERKKGKWVGKGSEGFGIFICDNCGKLSMMEYDFCPNCGCRMEEGEK